MPKEVILCGFKVQVPLTPADRKEVEAIARGLDQMRIRVGLMPALLVPQDGLKALSSIHLIVESLLVADDAAAGPDSPTPRR